jgi:hypothetical protein
MYRRSPVRDDNRPYHDEAIEIEAADYSEGALSRRSYVAPWAVVSLRREHIEKRVAQLSSDVVAETTTALGEYVES